MSAAPVLASPARDGLLGVLRSWLHARSGEAGHPLAPVNATLRVLVVDDNPVNLMVVSAMMESRGFVPLLAADGAEAVALACELHFDLILMDLQMPVLDGLRATSAIRSFEATHARPAVPVVAYSSLTPGALVLARHGIDGSLNKPCDDQELEDCLLRWCLAYHPASRPASAARGVDGSSRQPASRGAATTSVSLR